MRIVKWTGSRRHVISLAAAAAALGLVAPTPANAMNDGVPVKARLSGTVAFTSPTTVEFHGGGQATHLGQLMNGGVAILDPPTGTCPSGLPGIPNVHTETLTAASGDEVVIRMVDVACPIGPLAFHGTGDWTVLGGTGRFEGVTGEGTAEGDVDFETNTFAIRLSGTLNITP